MSEQEPEDFTAESEVDDVTQLARRRREAAAEPDESTQLSQRRRPLVEADLDEETRMALRRADGLTSAGTPPTFDDQDDATRVSNRGAETQAGAAPSRTRSSPNESAAPTHPYMGTELSPLPPGEAPIGMPAHEGGFGERTAAYRPRMAAAATPLPDLPPATASDAAEQRQPVLAPAEAQRRRESVRRTSVGKAIAIGVAILVLGSTAIVSIVLLIRGLP